MNVEECLRVIESKAALLPYLSDAVSVNAEHPDPPALAGMGEVSGDIEELARTLKQGLRVGVLGVELKAARR